MIQQILQFARTFQGASSPKEMAMRYINSGQMTNENMEQCKEIAAFLQQSFGDCPVGMGTERKRSAWET